jgi:diguanylate cyclase (GGDEF)-like protein
MPDVGDAQFASPSVQVQVAIAGALLMLFAITAFIATPRHYPRSLVLAAGIVHFTSLRFGSRFAWRAAWASAAGYALLVTSVLMRHLPLSPDDQLWGVATFAAGASLVFVREADVSRRLRHLLSLFENAEEGDFSKSYQVGAHEHADAITRIGQAYNRVRAQLSSMVLTDALTGCLNRRGFDQSLSREVARSARAGGEFAVLAVDLDHFKNVNDTYGHLAGDIILREVGAMLVGAGRAGDVVARVGGEEFAILLPETGAAGALLFAERLCERIRTHRFVLSPDRLPVSITTSIGVAHGRPRGEEGFAAHLWSRADDALYAAKRANRDCVREWDTSMRSSGSHLVIAQPVTEHFFS